MTEKEKKPAGAGKKKNYRFGQRYGPPKSAYKSKVVAGIKDDTFDVRASSDPSKFSKSLKNIETYIQRMYKMLDKIVKAIQNLHRPAFDPPDKPDTR
jgi:hypothetical protein